MRSHPSDVTNTPVSALPVCLSGIGIHLSVQPSSLRRHHHHHRNEVTKPMPSCSQDSIVEPDVISRTEATLYQRLEGMTLNQVLLRQDILQERPRHALALQMADLDRRREAIKKHMSNRGFVNFMDEQRTLLQRHSHHKQSVISSMMHNPYFQSEFVTALEHNGCAKAA